MKEKISQNGLDSSKDSTLIDQFLLNLDKRLKTILIIDGFTIKIKQLVLMKILSF